MMFWTAWQNWTRILGLMDPKSMLAADPFDDAAAFAFEGPAGPHPEGEAHQQSVGRHDCN